MSAIVNESTSIIVPSTPTAGVATIPLFSATISPKAFSVEARLGLSLDDLIKERKKEVKKEKKHESVKKETTQLQTQKKKNQKSDRTTKNAQSVKRNALANKNRGLPALPAASNPNTSNNGSKSAKKKKRTAPKTVVGKKAAAANKRVAATQQQKNKQNKKPAANAKNAGRKVASPKAMSGSQMPQTQQQKKKPQQVHVTQQQQPKKNKAHQQQPTKSNKAHANKNGNGGSIKTLTVVTKEQARKVVRSRTNKAANIRITIKQAPSISNKFSNKNLSKQAQKKKNKSKKTQPKKTAIMNVVLPGKVARNFSNSQAARAQKVVKRVQNRKQSSSKNGTFVVRKPFVSRKN